MEWPPQLLEHPDASELLVAIDPAAAGGGGAAAAAAAAAQKSAAAASAAAHANSQYGPVSPNSGGAALVAGSPSSRGTAAALMLGLTTPSPSGTSQLRAAAGMGSHRLSSHHANPHHSPGSSPLPYQRPFWSNAGQGSLVGPSQPPPVLPSMGSGGGGGGGFAAGGFVGFGGGGGGGGGAGGAGGVGGGGANGASALHSSRLSGRLRMSAGTGPGSVLGSGGPGSHGPSSYHGPVSYVGGGSSRPSSRPCSRANSQYGRASQGDGLGPLYGFVGRAVEAVELAGPPASGGGGAGGGASRPGQRVHSGGVGGVSTGRLRSGLLTAAYAHQQSADRRLQQRASSSNLPWCAVSVGEGLPLRGVAGTQETDFLDGAATGGGLASPPVGVSTPLSAAAVPAVESALVAAATYASDGSDRAFVSTGGSMHGPGPGAGAGPVAESLEDDPSKHVQVGCGGRALHVGSALRALFSSPYMMFSIRTHVYDCCMIVVTLCRSLKPYKSFPARRPPLLRQTAGTRTQAPLPPLRPRARPPSRGPATSERQRGKPWMR